MPDPHLQPPINPIHLLHKGGLLIIPPRPGPTFAKQVLAVQLKVGVGDNFGSATACQHHCS